MNMLDLQKFKELYQIIKKETILALEIEGDYGRYWIKGKDAEIEKKLNNLSEDEYFSDLDVCTKQDNPICEEFYNYMYDTSEEHNKYKLFDTRKYFPMYLIEKSNITLSEIQKRDELLIQEISKKISKEYKFIDKNSYYQFFVETKNFKCFIEFPLMIDLSKELNENLYCRVNSFVNGELDMSIPIQIKYSEIITFMNSILNDESFRMEVIKKNS